MLYFGGIPRGILKRLRNGSHTLVGRSVRRLMNQGNHSVP